MSLFIFAENTRNPVIIPKWILQISSFIHRYHNKTELKIPLNEATKITWGRKGEITIQSIR